MPHKGDPNAPTVIIGSHTDSVTGVGADDNGSGVVGILDALRVLKDAVYETTTNPLEFHFYSAEEQGLLGSNAIASEWKRQGRQVRGMVMADMTAYFRGKEVIAVIRDFVNPALTDFIVGQIGVYCEYGTRHSDR